MQKYNQLSRKNRHQIKVLLDAGLNQSQIACHIGVHRSTICRELQRNVAKRGSAASPDLAHKKTLRRHHNKPKHYRFSGWLKSLDPVMVD